MLIDSSHSETDSFRRCQRAHFYSKGLQIQGTKMSDALFRGIVGHNALAYYYQALKEGKTHQVAVDYALKDGLNDIFRQHDDLDQVVAIRPGLKLLLQQYFDTFENEADTIRVIAVEEPYRVEVADDYELKFVIDIIVSVPGSGIEVWDHKFVYNFYNPAALDLSPQLPMYLAGARILGYPVARARYNQLRYYETKENRGRPALKFRRQEVPITDQRVLTTMEEQVAVGERIAELKAMGVEKWEQNIVRAANGQICDRCSFSRICAGDLNGDDRRLYIGHDYRRKPPRD